ncbi:UBP-type zinc finger domain-containing protein [Micromonospora sp. 15K316]|uniref:UBP-type zinc finger domain-containing protein n=1 Tax=Micromonospora sp. 15K316 TaxID=2530376 RepID=UPI001FB69C63|nr:UBP-type zinc finger domain-containing protein [Micromonospora sp. 15K316]
MGDQFDSGAEPADVTAPVNPAVPPSGTGCLECDASGGWWFHLRRCAACGHIGCCDSSPSQHATAHAAATGHPVIQSFEPGESWFWDYSNDQFLEGGPELAEPQSHPLDQPAPGPRGRVPADWKTHLH